MKNKEIEMEEMNGATPGNACDICASSKGYSPENCYDPKEKYDLLMAKMQQENISEKTCAMCPECDTFEQLKLNVLLQENYPKEEITFLRSEVGRLESMNAIQEEEIKRLHEGFGTLDTYYGMQSAFDEIEKMKVAVNIETEVIDKSMARIRLFTGYYECEPVREVVDMNDEYVCNEYDRIKKSVDDRKWIRHCDNCGHKDACDICFDGSTNWQPIKEESK
jgi:hypothetical protein